MEIPFYKYQGTGNDFVLIDARASSFPARESLIAQLCDRRYGVGADGLMVLGASENPAFDFTMDYFNSDGRRSTMCGNGGRCIALLARELGLGDGKSVRFRAPDGPHTAFFTERNVVRLRMNDVRPGREAADRRPRVQVLDNYGTCFLDTGSPHFVIFPTAAPKESDILHYGRLLRYDPAFAASEGTNVDFVLPAGDGTTLHVRTYERGVESETFSCGTGAVAAALAARRIGLTARSEADIRTKGGALHVEFREDASRAGGYTDIWLTGEARRVFKGIFTDCTER